MGGLSLAEAATPLGCSWQLQPLFSDQMAGVRGPVTAAGAAELSNGLVRAGAGATSCGTMEPSRAPAKGVLFIGEQPEQDVFDPTHFIGNLSEPFHFSIQSGERIVIVVPVEIGNGRGKGRWGISWR
jgi:hypothetical protein